MYFVLLCRAVFPSLPAKPVLEIPQVLELTKVLVKSGFVLVFLGLEMSFLSPLKMHTPR